MGAQVGTFPRFVAPVLVELLKEHGIDSQEGETPQSFYRRSRPDQALVIVRKEELGEARRIAAEELPPRLLEIEEAMGKDPSFADGVSLDEEIPVDPWTAATQNDEDVEEYDAEPIGFMEPAVARVFVEMCEEVDIGADTEYSLEESPPAYARADGRVRVHVEDVFLGPALSLMKEELPGELARRGIAYTQPFLEAEEP